MNGLMHSYAAARVLPASAAPGASAAAAKPPSIAAGVILIPPFDRDFDGDSDASLGSGWFVQTVGHRRTEPGEAIARASYVNDSGRDRHRPVPHVRRKCGAAGHSGSEWAKLGTA